MMGISFVYVSSFESIANLPQGSERLCAAGIPSYTGGELFSLRKKRSAGIRLSAWQTFRSLHRSHPTPFPPLKRRESKGSQLPLAEVWGQRPQGLALRGPSGSQRPVLPKPPVPRAVLSSSGTSRSSGVQTGASTSCAIRSPGWISKGVSLWLVRGTWSSPR